MTGPWTPRSPIPRPAEEGATRSALHHLCPGFAADGPATRTETSLLLPGQIDGMPVIAKHPIDRRPFWLQRSRHETTIYQQLLDTAPDGVCFPRLVAADPTAYLLVITRLPGEPLGPDRYPTRSPSHCDLDMLLAALTRLHAWQPRGDSPLPGDHDYPAQYARLRGLFGPGDLAAVQRVYARVSPHLGQQVTHGDAHLGNALALPGGDVALIDLEVTAVRLPWFDHAMLWVLLGDHPHARDHILGQIFADTSERAAFWLAATLICGREVISHRRHAPTWGHQRRLHRLEADLRRCFHHLDRFHSLAVS